MMYVDQIHLREEIEIVYDISGSNTFGKECKWYMMYGDVYNWIHVNMYMKSFCREALLYEKGSCVTE